MQAVAPAGVGGQCPLANRLSQSLVGKQLTHHGRTRCLAGGIGFVDEQSRPQHHAVGLRVTGSHPQRERVLRKTRLGDDTGDWEGQRGGEGGAADQETAAGGVHDQTLTRDLCIAATTIKRFGMNPGGAESSMW